MSPTDLARLVRSPNVKGYLLGNYDGPYVLGITTLPDQPGQLAIALNVPNPEASTFPNEVALDGETVPVLLGKFEIPTAF